MADVGNPLQQLAEHGQSVWLDFISRELVTSGEFDRLIATSNVTGLTSNPTIFQKAIAEGNLYDDQIRDLLNGAATSLDDLFFDLAVSDIQRACDELRSVWERTKSADGFASLEVAPAVAHDTQATVAMVKKLWHQVDRPNLMVKIPATPEGIPAIEQCLTEGMNINVTLIFALSAYEDVINAYLNALEARQRSGKSLNVHSVASFFVSRVDTAVDPMLEKAGNTELQGKAAIANAVLAYELYEKHFVHGERFQKLRAAGAYVQRPLWASTSAKNPRYRDVVYAEALIGPDTVDTMPPATVDAFRDHGVVERDTVNADYPGAHRVIEDLSAAGITMETVTADLLKAGVASFGKSYDELIEGLAAKIGRLTGDYAKRETFFYESSESAEIDAAIADLGLEAAVQRVWDHDADLWKPGNEAHAAVIHNRLGWLDVLDAMRNEVPRLEALAESLISDGIRNVVVLGMGGSSLCPEVIRSSFAPPASHPSLHVLDTTDPVAVATIDDEIDPNTTAFIVASKSGTTIETLSHFSHFHSLLSNSAVTNPGRRFIAITDPGSPLADLAARNGFREIFLNPENIGGRYSAMSFFGLVPAACVGVNVSRLLERAVAMRAHCLGGLAPQQNCGLRLGAAMAHFQKMGRDKLTILASSDIANFSLWAEQLIAESTGKEGTEIIPISLEPLTLEHEISNDRFFVSLSCGKDEHLDQMVERVRSLGHPILSYRLDDLYDLGAEIFRWEFATALAGAVLRIDPFDEPNVQESKDNTKAVLAQLGVETAAPVPVATTDAGDFYGMSWSDLLASIAPGDYFALMAYLTPSAAIENALQSLRAAIAERYRVATTLGFGPRFLHSTGQLHKGGPNIGVFLQITTDDAKDVRIPNQPFGFSTLKAAQAAGDFTSLQSHGRRVTRLHLHGDIGDALLVLTHDIKTAAGVHN